MIAVVLRYPRGPHQGRELQLMREQVKPAALITAPTAQLYGFMQHVARDGWHHMPFYLDNVKRKSHRAHVFTLPQHKDRIRPLVAAFQTVPRPHVLIGQLLGYTDEEIGAFMEGRTLYEID